MIILSALLCGLNPVIYGRPLERLLQQGENLKPRP